jgi:hypothetical protein
MRSRKNIANHQHTVALFHMHHNFVRVHQSLRVTPAMASGISQHVWSVLDIVKLKDALAKGIAA